MHQEVKEYCLGIKQKFPGLFKKVDVLDCGSIDINGNNRYLFEASSYLGIDIAEGKNVDIVIPVHLFNPPKQYDVVISTEMLEHDRNYIKSLINMASLTKTGGLLLFTAAGTGRAEHGTSKANPQDSPLTPDYYCNITVSMILHALHLERFSWYEISYLNTDIRFAGIKR
jgi:SAM-dependent methyltransferase